jgi:hypothetical protein
MTLEEYSARHPGALITCPDHKGGRKKGFKQSKEFIEAMRARSIGKLNHFYGKKHTDETRRKMSENHADFSGDANPFRRSLEDPKKRAAHGERMKKIWSGRSAEWVKSFKEKVSMGVCSSEKFKACKHHKNHKSSHEVYYDKVVFFRSSWESIIAEYLYSSPLIECFQVEQCIIPYEDTEGSKRNTKVDFTVLFSNGTVSLMEVKPKVFIKDNLHKFSGIVDYALHYGVQFHVITEDHLDKEVFYNLLQDIYNEKCENWYEAVLNL